jgi:hypothetical protein
MSKNILLISDTIIKERSIVNGNTDPKLIYPDIKVAQDMYVLPILGTALFNKIQDAVAANDWTGLTNYKTLLDDYIIDTLVNYTQAELPMGSYQFTNKERNHILIIREVKYENSTPKQIVYTHSVAYPEDGLYNTGPRNGTIDIVDANLPITKQNWSEENRQGQDNKLFVRATNSLTEVRRLNFF